MATLNTSRIYDGQGGNIYSQITYSVSTSETQVNITVSKMNAILTGQWAGNKWNFQYYSSNSGGQNNLNNAANYGYKSWSGGSVQVIGTQGRNFARQTSAYTVTLYCRFQINNGGWYSGSTNITIPALDSYSVSFNGNGATGGYTGGQTKYYGIDLTLNANGYSKAGYEFIGWNTSSDATWASYGNNSTYSGNSSITLYAIWRKAITVSYNANGGAGAPGASTGYAYNSATATSITLSNTVPTRTGYSTDGWATSPDGSKVYNRNTSYSFSNSTTIYAHWNPVTYTINYDLAGGALPSGQTNPTTYNIETNTFTLNEPTKQYYEFIGWTGSNGNTPTKNLSIAKGSIDNRNYVANWRSTWDNPGVNIVTVRRASDSADDDSSGERLYLEFTWTPGKDTTNPQSPVNKNPTSYVIKVDGSDGTSRTKTYTMPSTSPVTRKYESTDIFLAIDVTYTVTLTIKTTGYPDTILTDYISEAYFIMDINSDGTAIGFGRQAGDIGYFDCDFRMRTQDNSMIFRAIFDIMHPVGSWYLTSLRPKKTSGETGKNMVDYFDPTEAWGGTWVLLEEGKVLLSGSQNGSYVAGNSYGGNTKSYTPSGSVSVTVSDHTLDTNQIPSHGHIISDNSLMYYSGSANNNRGTGSWGWSGGNVSQFIGNNGSGWAHSHGGSGSFTGTASTINVMQNSVATYVWHRTA